MILDLPVFDCATIWPVIDGVELAGRRLQFGICAHMRNKRTCEVTHPSQ